MMLTPSLCCGLFLGNMHFIISKNLSWCATEFGAGAGAGDYQPLASPSALRLGPHGLQRVAAQRKLSPHPLVRPLPKRRKREKRGEMRVAEGNISPAEGAA